ncbi:hypothetical protein PG993_013925 [Apiospora rasikravindrae]|uniref:Uncharacterized protein n=1 Tax=Apiospora rasikravindrae TaxID=990691 RepID=A0ABR1RSR7_9PEZI
MPPLVEVPLRSHARRPDGRRPGLGGPPLNLGPEDMRVGRAQADLEWGRNGQDPPIHAGCAMQAYLSDFSTGSLMSALSADGSTVVLSVYIPGDEVVTTTATATTTQYLPSTTTSYITTTKTVSNESLPLPTASSATATATTTPSTGIGRDTGPSEDLVADPAPDPAPSKPPLANSANPAVIGGITGTFGGLAMIGIVIFISLRRRKRRTVIDDECIRTRMYEIPAYEPKFSYGPGSNSN